MERDIKKITTPRGTEVEIKTYLTGGEVRQIQGLLLRNAELGNVGEDGKPEINNIRADAFLEMEKKTLELAIVSVAGSKENIVARLQDLPADEYQYVVNEATKLTTDFLGVGKK